VRNDLTEAEPEPELQPIRKAQGHGTPARARQHYRDREKPCASCHAAFTQYQQDVRNGAGKPRKTAAHGTYSGYSAHKRRGETPCDDCAEAGRKYKREYRARRKAAANEIASDQQ
jgi:hypothetical protein